MRKIREFLRLRALGCSQREIAASLGIGRATVSRYVRRAESAGLSWPLPDDFDDDQLDAALYPSGLAPNTVRPVPDWAEVHRQKARHKGMTLQRLWIEYREAHPDGYEYSWFCERYKEWTKRIDVVMRQVYKAGDRVFVDYAGPTVPLTDRKTGEVRGAMVFVGTLAASNHTFVDLTLTRSLSDWTGSHVRMFEFWGGVPNMVVPDNERVSRAAGVSIRSEAEPELR